MRLYEDNIIPNINKKNQIVNILKDCLTEEFVGRARGYGNKKLTGQYVYNNKSGLNFRKPIRLYKL